MTIFKQKKFWVLFGIIIILSGAMITLLFTLKPTPIAVAQEYGMGMLWEEAEAMNECAECHSSQDFHTCKTCHDDHGAVELADVRFFEVVELTGDVPDPSFVRVNEIMPDQETMGTHILLFDFLEKYAVDDFVSVSFFTNDGGLTTIERQYLDETAMLVPYLDGVRFITESVHSSTWLKGITRIVIVGVDTPITIDGHKTSIGRLLLGETVRVTVEGSEVMMTDDSDQTNLAFVANWIEGTRLLPILDSPTSNNITVTDSTGNTVKFSAEEMQNAVIALNRDEVTLVLPDRGRSAWVTDIEEIESH